jgi:hypothetical protein
MYEFGIPHGIIDLVKACYRNPKGRMKMGAKLSKEFGINSGLRQGCVLSPVLFNLVMEKVHRTVSVREEGITVDDKKLSMLAFADDVDIVVESEAELISFLPPFVRIGERLGLVINQNKTKMMKVSRQGNPGNTGVLTTGNMNYEKVRSFRYLGVNVNENNIMPR